MTRERVCSESTVQALDFAHNPYGHDNAEVLMTHLSAFSRIIPGDVHSYNEVNVAQHHVIYNVGPDDFTQVPNANESARTLTAQHTIRWTMSQAEKLLKQAPDWNPQRPDQLSPIILTWARESEPAFRTIATEEIFAPITAEQLISLGLSKRESEVLAWVGQGKTNKEVGHLLGCSHRTVQKHLERIYIKLGVENRTAAAILATEAARAFRSSTLVN